MILFQREESVMTPPLFFCTFRYLYGSNDHTVSEFLNLKTVRLSHQSGTVLERLDTCTVGFVSIVVPFEREAR